jgi:hypothetical protein
MSSRGHCGASPSPRAAVDEPAAVDALVLDPADNVAVALRDLPAGRTVAVAGRVLALRDPIPFGHKLALEPITPGSAIRKYAEVIGVAREEITLGAHVHVHNVVSARLPGPEGADA